jgi:hypothetical protein
VHTDRVYNNNDLTIDARSPQVNSTVFVKNTYPSCLANLDVSGVVIPRGGIDFVDMGVRPSCNSVVRGRMWFTEKGVGYADQFCICKKDRHGIYNWVNIGRDDNLTGYTC